MKTALFQDWPQLRLLAGAFSVSVMVGLMVCAPAPAEAQDFDIPLGDIDVDPTRAPAEGTDTRFTDDLLRDAEKYATGKGQRYNATRAYELYKKAAESGRPLAVYQVARFLILGEGVPKDEKKGIRILDDLAAIIVQAKDFRQRRGFNPVTRKPFTPVSQLRASAIKVSDFKAKDGTEVIGPEILSISEQSLRMMHSTGISTFNWDELPAFVQSAIGYDRVSTLFEAAILKALESPKS